MCFICDGHRGHFHICCQALWDSGISSDTNLEKNVSKAFIFLLKIVLWDSFWVEWFVYIWIHLIAYWAVLSEHNKICFSYATYINLFNITFVFSNTKSLTYMISRLLVHLAVTVLLTVATPLGAVGLLVKECEWCERFFCENQNVMACQFSPGKSLIKSKILNFGKSGKRQKIIRGLCAGNGWTVNYN